MKDQHDNKLNNKPHIENISTGGDELKCFCVVRDCLHEIEGNNPTELVYQFALHYQEKHQ